MIESDFQVGLLYVILCIACWFFTPYLDSKDDERDHALEYDIRVSHMYHPSLVDDTPKHSPRNYPLKLSSSLSLSQKLSILLCILPFHCPFSRDSILWNSDGQEPSILLNRIYEPSFKLPSLPSGTPRIPLYLSIVIPAYNESQ